MPVPSSFKPSFDLSTILSAQNFIDRKKVQDTWRGTLEGDVSSCICHSLLHGFPDYVRGIDEANGMARLSFPQALAHLDLGIIQAHDPSTTLADEWLRNRKDWLVKVGEALRDVAGQLNVLLLVLADWDKLCLIEENVGGL